MSNDNSGVQVAIRVRKLINREVNACETIKWVVHEDAIWESERKDSAYTFDKILTENVTNEDAYEELAKKLVISAMDGINATIFAYGQTSSGKTHTMMGNESDGGIIPRAIKDIFQYCADHADERSFLLRVSYMEIYNETITDLLNTDKKEKLRVRENIRGEVYVKDLVEVLVTCEEDILSYLKSGESFRHFASTNMNERSSRSHTIFRLVVESTDKGSEQEQEGQARTVRVSQLNLVDLAGSERAKSTGAEGLRLKEGGHINTSLMVLSKVIKKLSEPGENNVIPFRESKLTRILQSSLGGNAKTSVICTMTPVALEETHSTLRFAKSAKLMKNKPKINEVMNDKAIISKYEKKIRNLERELAQKNQLETHIESRDIEIRALRGQLVGSVRTRDRSGECPSPSVKRRRETFFQGPQGLVASPRNLLKSRITDEGKTPKSDNLIARQLFALPATDGGAMEQEMAELRTGLSVEKEKSARYKNDLKELEEMCTEMGDKMQDCIDEQQEQIEGLSEQASQFEGVEAKYKEKITEFENILTRVGEERQDILDQLQDKTERVRQAEARNVLILQEAEEQRLDLQTKIDLLSGQEEDTLALASPSKKRKSTASPAGYNPQEIEELKAELSARQGELTSLRASLQSSALEADKKYEAVWLKLQEQTSQFELRRNEDESRYEASVSDLQDLIASLESSSNQKNEEFGVNLREMEKLREIAEQYELKFDTLGAETSRKISDLNFLLRDKEHEIAQVKLTNPPFRSVSSEELSNMSDEKLILENTIEDLHRCIGGVRGQLEDKTNEYEALLQNQPHIEELRVVLREKEDEIALLYSDKLKDDDSSASAMQLEQFAAEKCVLENTIKDLRTSFDDIKTQLETKIGEYDTLLKEHEDLEALRNTLTVRLDSHSSESATIAELERELQEITEQKEVSMKDSLDLANEYRKLREERDELSRTIKEKEGAGVASEINGVDESVVNNLNAKLGEMKTIMEEKDSENENILAEYEKLYLSKKTVESQSAEYQDAIKDLECKLTEANADLEQRTSEYQLLLKENTELKSSCDEFLDQRNMLDQRDGTEYQDAIKDLECKLTEANADLETRTSEYQLLIKEHTELKSSCGELLSKSNNQGEDEELRNMLDQRDGMVANLRLELEKSHLKVEEIESCKCKLNEDITKLTSDFEQKCDELNNAEDKIMHQQLESVDLKLQLEQQTTEQSIGLEKAKREEETRKIVAQGKSLMCDYRLELEKSASQINDLETLQAELQIKVSDMTADLEHKCAELDEARVQLTHQQLTSSDSKSLIEQMSIDHAKSLEAQNADVSAIQTLYDETLASNDKFKQLIDTNLARITELEATLAEAETHILQAECSVGESHNALTDANNRVAETAEALSQAHTRLSETESKVNEKVSQLCEIVAKLDYTERLLAESQAVVSQTENKLNESQHCLSEILECDNEETTTNKVNELLNDKISEIASLEQMSTSLKANLQTKSNEYDELLRQSKTDRELIASYEVKVSDEFEILEEKAAIEDELCNLQTDHKSHVALLNDLKVELEAKNSRMVELEAKCSRLVELEAKCSRLVEVEVEVTAKTEELAKLGSDYEEKLVQQEKKVNMLSMKLAEEIRAKKSLRDDCDELMNSLQRKERENKGKDEDLREASQLELLFEARNGEIKEKTEEIRVCVEHLEQMQQEQQQLKDANLKLNSELSDLQVITEKDEMLAAREKDELLAAHEGQITEKTEEIRHCVEHIEQIQEELQQHKDSNLKLNSELSDLKSRIVAEATEHQAELDAQIMEKTEELKQLENNSTILSTEFKSRIEILTGERDNLNEKVLELQSQIKLQSESAEGENAKELELTKQQLESTSHQLSSAQQEMKALAVKKDEYAKQKQTLENEVENLQKNILEYEMMKTDYIKLKSSYDSLLQKKNLSDAAKCEAEKDLSDYQSFFESAVNKEKAKQEEAEEINKTLKTEIEALKNNVVEVERDFKAQIEKLISERQNLHQQLKEFSSNLSKGRQDIANHAEQEEKLSAKLKDQTEKCERLEKKKVEDERDYLDLYNKHQAMCNEADEIESKYNLLDEKFAGVKSSLEKEIIRRKYVEQVAKVNPKTYNPTSLEDFIKELDSDYTAYLERIKRTYRDVGVVCQTCNKRRQLKSPNNSQPNDSLESDRHHVESKPDVSHAQQDASRAQRDLPHAQRDLPHAQRDVPHAQRDVPLPRAQRDVPIPRAQRQLDPMVARGNQAENVNPSPQVINIQDDADTSSAEGKMGPPDSRTMAPPKRPITLKQTGKNEEQCKQQ